RSTVEQCKRRRHFGDEHLATQTTRRCDLLGDTEVRWDLTSSMVPHVARIARQMRLSVPRTRERQGEPEDRTALAPRSRGQLPTMRSHDIGGDREPEAHTLFLGREERIEQPRQILFPDADAIVLDLDYGARGTATGA